MPAVVGWPDTSMLSFTASVSPSSGPRLLPAARRASLAAAAARAPSASRCRKAFNRPLRWAISANTASVKAALVTRPSANARDCALRSSWITS